MGPVDGEHNHGVQMIRADSRESCHGRVKAQPVEHALTALGLEIKDWKQEGPEKDHNAEGKRHGCFEQDDAPLVQPPSCILNLFAHLPRLCLR